MRRAGARREAGSGSGQTRDANFWYVHLCLLELPSSPVDFRARLIFYQFLSRSTNVRLSSAQALLPVYLRVQFNLYHALYLVLWALLSWL